MAATSMPTAVEAAVKSGSALGENGSGVVAGATARVPIYFAEEVHGLWFCREHMRDWVESRGVYDTREEAEAACARWAMEFPRGGRGQGDAAARRRLAAGAAA